MLMQGKMGSETHNIDCIEYCKTLETNSVDVILTDPPYKYLKNQKLETDFNEIYLFEEWKRIIKKGGFIILFGRGTSFYRWNYMLSEMGFEFKEEIIWNKNYTSSPVHTINRVHETISIFTKDSNSLNKVKIPYEEARNYEDLQKVINDINRLKSVFNNEESFNHVLNYINGFRTDLEIKRSTNYATSCQTKALGSQTVSPMIAIKEGMKIKSIISLNREHYATIHPTQKPVKLLERLLMLVKKSDNDLVLDCFLGSQSTRIASYNLGLDFIGCELDRDYFEQGNKRFEQYKAQTKLF